MMKWIFDAILVLIMLIGLIRGYRAGLITLLFKRFRGLAAMVLAFVFARPLASVLDLSAKITAPVKDLLLEYVKDSAPDDMATRVPTVIKSLAHLFHVDITGHANDAASAGGDYIEIFVESASAPLANTLAVVGAFIVVLVGAFIVLWIAGKVINVVFKLPILKQINTLCGAVAGLFFFGVFAWILCKLSVFAIDLVPNVEFLNHFDIESTIIGKFLFHLDPMKLLLSL